MSSAIPGLTLNSEVRVGKEVLLSTVQHPMDRIDNQMDMIGAYRVGWKTEMLVRKARSSFLKYLGDFCVGFSV